MDGLEQEGRPADQVRERRALKGDCAATVNLRLTKERQMVGVHRDGMWATVASVGRAPSIRPAAAGARRTPSPQGRQACSSWRRASTRDWAGMTSSRSETSSPMQWSAPRQQGQLLSAMSPTRSIWGPRIAPSSIRFANRQTPVPSKTSSYTGSARFARKT
ncbi:hypothetical protein GCM10011322_37830 [Salinarimonas ramus]|uniref:Uncharacterized protein n=1 Tax=Salinarimonas ramus TaxID=690164 RepID=A0A917QES4_9HYPH|nr:hypothetical protein GCM10011322_37830 [Salinarimonas ramus]